MSDEYTYDDMVEMMKRQEELARSREGRDIEHYKMNLLGLKLRERQVKALEELVKEIKRLRITGIQP